VWQKVFIGPGVNVTTDIIYAQPSKPSEEQDAGITLELQGIRFLSDIDVTYTDDDSPRRDSIVVVEMPLVISTGAVAGSTYVWLIPKWTYKVQEACSYVDVLIQDHADGRYKDLAKGAKGDWRYLNPVRNTNNPKKVMDIQLLRLGHAESPETIKERLGFDGRSRDLNEGRKHDWLYLVWKTFDFGVPVFES
ncbi:hypothetical protein BJX61DRAFT_546173, partial [Aspergillus egyptiacus]